MPQTALKRPPSQTLMESWFPDGKGLAGATRSALAPCISESLRRLPQFAYLPGRGLSDAPDRVVSHLREARQLIQEARPSRHELHAGVQPHGLAGGVTFALDLSQAFDTVSRQDIIDNVAQLGASEDVVLACCPARRVPDAGVVATLGPADSFLCGGAAVGSKGCPRYETGACCWMTLRHALLNEFLRRVGKFCECTGSNAIRCFRYLSSSFHCAVSGNPTASPFLQCLQQRTAAGNWDPADQTFSK